MFSEAPVSHSVHGGSLYDVTSCLAAWSFWRGPCAWFHVPSGGLCPERSLCPGTVSVKGMGSL